MYGRKKGKPTEGKELIQARSNFKEGIISEDELMKIMENDIKDRMNLCRFSSDPWVSNTMNQCTRGHTRRSEQTCGNCRVAAEWESLYG